MKSDCEKCLHNAVCSLRLRKGKLENRVDAIKDEFCDKDFSLDITCKHFKKDNGNYRDVCCTTHS